MKKIWWIAGIIVFIIVIAVSSNSKKNADSDTIKIGFIGPLSGDAASYGEVISRGALIAVNEINSNGGIGGKKIEFIIEDSKCDGTAAVSAVQKLININKISYLINGICSTETISTAPILDKNKIIGISPSATSPAISGISKYVFRNAPSDAIRGVNIAELLLQTYKKPAIISAQTDYSQGLRNTYLATIKNMGGVVVADENYLKDLKDFRGQLIKIKSSGADAVFLNPQTPPDLVRLAEQAKDIGINAQFFASEFNDSDVAKSKATYGMLVAVAPNISNNDLGTNVVNNYKKIYGIDPEYPYYVGAAYDIINIFAQSIKNTNGNIDNVRNYISNLRDFKGSIGNYGFDSKGDITGIKFIFQKNESGKFVNL
jgi:branched-chain amino acid transport system substrate-binding protein